MKLIKYFKNLLIQKLALRGDAAVRRIEAVCAADWERVEFLEQMMLKPLSRQIYYLSRKLLDLLKKEGK